MWGTIIMPCCIVVLLTYGLPVVYVSNINLINLGLLYKGCYCHLSK